MINYVQTDRPHLRHFGEQKDGRINGLCPVGLKILHNGTGDIIPRPSLALDTGLIFGHEDRTKAYILLKFINVASGSSFKSYVLKKITTDAIVESER